MAGDKFLGYVGIMDIEVGKCGPILILRWVKSDAYLINHLIGSSLADLGLDKIRLVRIDIMLSQYPTDVLNAFLDLLLVIGTAGVGQQVLQHKYRDIGGSLYRTNNVFSNYIALELFQEFLVKLYHNSNFLIKTNHQDLCSQISL